MDKSRQRKRLNNFFLLHCLREILTFIISIIFWSYFICACVLIIGSLLNRHDELLLTIRTILNIDRNTIVKLFNLSLKFIILDIFIFSLFLISRKISYKKEGIDHGDLF
ncbi:MULTISPECIES: intracellular adhesion protein IcaD [Staphylococcus]|uniref:intracellular adhesion protein IcaD n=1 Tax=Staphylococcus TaxID=1279 RepID=UPI0009F740C6|nr:MULTISPECIES: intracellular adhesion protein IcaD [Staphylococcus]MCC3712338.1 intracellular adhesion protein D [Staphylococcus hominis]MCI2865725.1 intracellular adhesion protein IcaD [Staphylococcus hominis]MCI2908944.1 intracellular adhesion protein IcaD [Staphylococcus hominis]MCI2911095.1 intracellular adhesion protein IcaD [Staphylococcus hominis]MCT1508997.1 intracellular adhesion protein IcaD [Staphylococcus hominis]